MTCRSTVSDLLPAYVAGTLTPCERRTVEEHLSVCPECREELALWREISAAVVAEERSLPAPPPTLMERVLARARRSRPGLVVRAWALLRAQAPLVRREIWTASALVMALGYVAAVLAGSSRGGSILQALAPLVAAAGLAMIYGPENDPGLELALATPTSPRQVLLARLALVFGYDLVLAVAATLGLAALVPLGPLGDLILGWLAPMAFLSALGLVLSMCIGTTNAVSVAFGLWLARGLASPVSLRPAAAAYLAAWRNPVLLFSLAMALVVVALWLAGKRELMVRGV